MIEIPQPSIALNALNSFKDKHYNVPGTKYEMWQTWDVPSTASASWVVTNTSSLASGAADGVKCLVINCHGYYEKGTNKSGGEKPISTGGFGFGIGQGINYANADLFSQLRGLVKCIIVVACGTAFVTNAKTASGDGELLCSKIARATDAYVIAPRTLQLATCRKLPKNYIDNFEGEVVRFNRAGVIDDYRFLGRKLIKEIFN